MKSQSSEHDEKKQANHQGSRLTYLVAGLGIGALVGILLAPQSGDETREWFASKYKDGMDSVNAKVNADASTGCGPDRSGPAAGRRGRR